MHVIFLYILYFLYLCIYILPFQLIWSPFQHLHILIELLDKYEREGENNEETRHLEITLRYKGV